MCLSERGNPILPSIGSPGDAYEGAAAESFMASFTTELVQRERFKRRDDMRLAVSSYMEAFYNPLRRHSALDYRSTAEYEKMPAVNRRALAPVTPQGAAETGQHHRTRTHERRRASRPMTDVDFPDVVD